MKKVKVLHVIGNLSIGGAENVAMNLYRYIDREKFEFDYLVYGSDIGEYEEEVEKLGGKVIHIDPPSKNYISFTKKISSAMKVNGPYDIVHSHTLFNSGLVLEAAKRINIKKRIAHSHSTQNKLYTSKLLQWYEKFMKYKILKNGTDYLACSNEAGSFLFGKDNFNKKGLVLKNGIEVEKYKFNNNVREKVRKEFNLEDKIVIGHTGHLATVKNQIFLIEVFKCLTDIHSDMILMLVGEGNERNKIEKRIKDLNLSSSVIMTGNRTDVNEILQAMDIFVFPSLYEGLGLSIIEAQTSGLPCFVSDRIPNEAFITDNIKSISLEENAILWANMVSNCGVGNRELHYKQIEKQGYNVKFIGSTLESIYREGMT